MRDITAKVLEQSGSVAKLTRYLDKSSLTLSIGLRMQVSSMPAPMVERNSSPIDTEKRTSGIQGSNVDAVVFALDHSSRSRFWNLQDTLTLKRILMERGYKVSSLLRNSDIWFKPPNGRERGQVHVLFGTVLEIELAGYHSTTSGYLLFSHSDYLRDPKWVRSCEDYIRSVFNRPALILLAWSPKERPYEVELKKGR